MSSFEERRSAFYRSSEFKKRRKEVDNLTWGDQRYKNFQEWQNDKLREIEKQGETAQVTPEDHPPRTAVTLTPDRDKAEKSKPPAEKPKKEKKSPPSSGYIDPSKFKWPRSTSPVDRPSVPAEPFKFKQALALLGLFAISTAGLGLVNPWLMGVPILVVADYLAVFKSDLGWSGWGLGFIVLINILPVAFIINGVTYDPSSTARQTPPPIVEQSDIKPASANFTIQPPIVNQSDTQPTECVTVPFDSTAADPVAEAKESAATRLGKKPNLLAVENLQQKPDGETIDVCGPIRP